MSKKIVISGGPCSGKTAVVEKFKEKGYYTLPEPARILGEESGIRFSNKFTGKKRFEISNKIFEKYLEQESTIPRNKIVILDTGMPDNIPYYYLYCPRMKIQEKYLEACKNRYDLIFILEPLNYFEMDDVRRESREEAVLLHQMKYNAYKSFGYELIFVPLFSNEKEKSIRKRVEFIENEIKKFK